LLRGKKWEDGEMGRWEDGKMGWGKWEDGEMGKFAECADVLMRNFFSFV
jgi:hypothetical protein